MTVMPHPAVDPVSTASPGAINVIVGLMEARTGQQIATNRIWRIDTALRPLIAAEGIGSVDVLVARLLAGGDAKIGDRIVDCLLNQETSFFRDAGVLEAAAAAALRIAAARGGGRARIWSAGCATGQEPLSLSMYFAEMADLGGLPPEIVATDVSEAALGRARTGRYSQFEIQRGLPVRRMMQWFDSVGGDWVAKPELARAVQFRRHNIVADPAPAGLFDAIFCRNVLFYLNPTLRGPVLDRLSDALHPGGLLILGAGETVIGQTDRMRPSAHYRGFYEAVTPPYATPAVYKRG